jgi:hypothetical protein
LLFSFALVSLAKVAQEKQAGMKWDVENQFLVFSDDANLLISNHKGKEQQL